MGSEPPRFTSLPLAAARCRSHPVGPSPLSSRHFLVVQMPPRDIPQDLPEPKFSRGLAGDPLGKLWGALGSSGELWGSSGKLWGALGKLWGSSGEALGSFGNALGTISGTPGTRKQKGSSREGTQNQSLYIKKFVLPNSRSPAPGGHTGNTNDY